MPILHGVIMYGHPIFLVVVRIGLFLHFIGAIFQNNCYIILLESFEYLHPSRNKCCVLEIRIIEWRSSSRIHNDCVLDFSNKSVSKHFMEASVKFNAFALLGFAWFPPNVINE